MKQLKMMTLLALVAALVTASTACTFSAGKGGSTGVSQRVELVDVSLDSTSGRASGGATDPRRDDRSRRRRPGCGRCGAVPVERSCHDRLADQSPLQPRSVRPELLLPEARPRPAGRADEAAGKALFAHRSSRPGTDILGGLLAAGELFASQPAGSRTLVLSSNMWAYSPSDGLNLKKQALSRAEITRLVARLARAGKVAQLSGVCVYVVGAGLDPGRQIPNSIQLSMRAFWQAYFARTGALLRAWTPTLDSEPSC